MSIYHPKCVFVYIWLKGYPTVGFNFMTLKRHKRTSTDLQKRSVRISSSVCQCKCIFWYHIGTPHKRPVCLRRQFWRCPLFTPGSSALTISTPSLCTRCSGTRAASLWLARQLIDHAWRLISFQHFTLCLRFHASITFAIAQASCGHTTAFWIPRPSKRKGI